MNRVLLIAYHFPPLTGSSGIQRALRFARYLPEFGWQPIVLTAHPRAYEQTGEDQLGDIPVGVEVVRAPAWDSSRHFAIAGRYPGILARPDRWISWWLGGVFKGLPIIRKMKPDVIWSTYPIATAHLIGATLSGRTGLPWIADFRDPMVQPGYPSAPATRRSFERAERKAVTGARFSTFTTPGAARTYRERYPGCADRIMLLENGYDEESFDGVPIGDPLNAGKLTLLHSGIIYPSERDPSQLFAALALVRQRAPDYFARLKIRFRAAVHDDLLARLSEEHGVADAVQIMPAVAYRDALAEMMSADGLLILQAANCNEQIPAKIYEYFRAGRPMLALTDPAGDTASTARAAGVSAIAPLDDASAIADLITRFLMDPKEGTLPRSVAVAGASRRGRTEQLAQLLEATLERPDVAFP